MIFEESWVMISYMAIFGIALIFSTVAMFVVASVFATLKAEEKMVHNGHLQDLEAALPSEARINDSQMADD